MSAADTPEADLLRRRIAITRRMLERGREVLVELRSQDERQDDQAVLAAGLKAASQGRDCGDAILEQATRAANGERLVAACTRVLAKLEATLAEKVQA